MCSYYCQGGRNACCSWMRPRFLLVGTNRGSNWRDLKTICESGGVDITGEIFYMIMIVEGWTVNYCEGTVGFPYSIILHRRYAGISVTNQVLVSIFAVVLYIVDMAYYMVCGHLSRCTSSVEEVQDVQRDGPHSSSLVKHVSVIVRPGSVSSPVWEVLLCSEMIS